MKFGRKPPRPTMRSVRSAFVMEQHLNNLGPAPAISNDYVSAVDALTNGDWGMLGNDQLGDCTCADCGHGLMLRTANAATIVRPTTDDIIALYSAITGYNPNDPSTDQGADENQVCSYMETNGLLGHKSDGTGAVDYTNADHLKWCVQLFGACRLGFQVPSYAMDQFSAGKPWDVDSNADATIVGGHDVPIVKYDGAFYYVVTWGKLQPMTPAFLAAYNEEAHAELYFDWIQANGAAVGTNLNLDQLAADIAAVGPPDGHR